MDDIQVKLSIDAGTGNANLQFTQKTLDNLVRSVRETDTATKKFGDNFVQSFQNMRNVGQGFTEAMRLVEGVFGTGIKKAMDYELATAKLNGVMKSGGKDNEMNIGQMEAFASEISKSSLHTKAEIIDVQRMFMSFRNIGGGSINAATDAALGLSEVLGTDVRGATIALAKALDQGSEGMKSLNRQGLKLTDDELEHVKSLEEVGKTYEMQTYIIDLLSSKFKDLDSEIQKTDAFKINQAQKAFADLQKQAGILELSALRPLLTGLSNIIDVFGQLPAPIKGATLLLGQAAVAYALLNTTGIGATIKNLLTYDFGLRANKVAKLETIIMTKAMTAAEQAQALAAYESAVATKGFFASLGPVGWVIIAVTALATAWGLLSDNVATSKEVMSDDEKQIRKNKIEFDNLRKTVVDTTRSEEERTKALRSIDEMYPGLLTKTEKDIRNQSALKTGMARVNDEIERKIRLTVYGDRYKKALEKQVNLEDSIPKLEKKVKDQSAGDEMGVITQSDRDKLANDKKDLEEAKKDAQKWQGMMGTTSSGQNENAQETAETLLKRSTAGLTNNAVSNYVKELQDIDGKLIKGSETSKKVKAKIKALGDDKGGGSRYDKTGGTGLGYLKDDTKIELQNVTEIKDLYDVMDKKWGEIDKIVIKGKKGKVNKERTEEQQQKGRYQVMETLGKEIDTIMKDKSKTAEIDAEGRGADKTSVLEAKLKAMQEIVNEVNKDTAEWEAKGRKEFPIISKQKMSEWLVEIKKVENDINRAKYEEAIRGKQQEEELLSKRMENEHVGELDKLFLKEDYLTKELALAERYNQAEEKDKTNHLLEMNKLDKAASFARMEDRTGEYENQISKGKIKPEEGYKLDILDETKRLGDEIKGIKEDELLTDEQKSKLLEIAENTHQQKLYEIKRKYYDIWLGELAGLSMQEIETSQKILEQFSSMANSLMNIQNKKGQEEANNYRTTEGDKLEAKKKAALAGARTEAQKQKIEEDYAKKKDKIDKEANEKGQDRIKTAFALQKAAGIAGAMVSTYQGAAAALSLPPIGAGPLMGPILAAMTIAAGLANVASIASQDMPKFAKGGIPGEIMNRPNGIITGPGTGTSDSIYARISNREFIVNADATSRYRQLLEQINSNSFSTGGYAGSYGSINNFNSYQDNSEIKGLRKDMNNMMAAMSDRFSQPVLIGDEACRRIASKGIGKMKRTKI